jgi:uncharacterized protein with von Willebrand factor type A (vWA) domain
VSSRTALTERLHLFVDELRARGLPISMVERVDAMRAAELADLADRHALHTNLGATLVKNPEHLGVFDEVYDIFFRMSSPVRDEPRHAAAQTAASGAMTRTLDLDDALRTVLQDGSPALARQVAEQAVARYARFEPGRPAGGVMYEKWTLEGLGLGYGAVQPGTNADLVRRQIVTVIRELLVADRGAAAVARTLRTPLTADVDVSMASPAELAEIERTMRPLQRKLATTLMRRRRRNSGPLDVRATLRRSMATGGVPVTLVARPPRPTKPQLYVLADMSGSVANFAAFSISLMAAMGDAFSRLRTFAFVQDAVEVTDLLTGAANPSAAARAVRARVARNSLGNYTDYGRSLVRFHDTVHGELGHRSTVLILGDARGNNLPARASALAAIAQRSGAVYWLNPEPSTMWNTGDSLVRVYAPFCTEVLTCRSVNDLKRFIEDLA